MLIAFCSSSTTSAVLVPSLGCTHRASPRTHQRPFRLCSPSAFRPTGAKSRWLDQKKNIYAEGVTRGATRRGGGASDPKRLDEEEEEEEDLLHSAIPPSATFVRDAMGHSEMVYDVELPAIDMGRVGTRAYCHLSKAAEELR